MLCSIFLIFFYVADMWCAAAGAGSVLEPLLCARHLDGHLSPLLPHPPLDPPPPAHLQAGPPPQRSCRLAVSAEDQSSWQVRTMGHSPQLLGQNNGSFTAADRSEQWIILSS